MCCTEDRSISLSPGWVSLSSTLLADSHWMLLLLCLLVLCFVSMRDLLHWQRWNNPLFPWKGGTRVHLQLLIDSPLRTPPFGSAVSQRPLQWPHHHVGAPPQWEQSQGWAGPTGNSLRSTRPQLPAAACIGGALPGTAALSL